MSMSDWKKIALFGLVLLGIEWWNPEAADWIGLGVLGALIISHPQVLDKILP